MRKSRTREQAAIEAVARYVSAISEQGDGDGPGAYLTLAGQRIAVEVAAIEQRLVEAHDLAKPRLRFDKVALRFVGGLRATLSAFVPEDEAVIVTITAPIRLPAKTAAALEHQIRDCLARPAGPMEVKAQILGNEIRFRRVKGVSTRMAKVIGFVHNPDSDPDILLRLTQSLLRHIGTAADKRLPESFAGARWLVVASDDGLSHIETYRQVCAQLSLPTGFEKILMVLADGRVETLSG